MTAAAPETQGHSFLNAYSSPSGVGVEVVFDALTHQVAFIEKGSSDPYDLAGSGMAGQGHADGDELEHVIAEMSQAARDAGWIVVSSDQAQPLWHRNVPE